MNQAVFQKLASATARVSALRGAAPQQYPSLYKEAAGLPLGRAFRTALIKSRLMARPTFKSGIQHLFANSYPRDSRLWQLRLSAISRQGRQLRKLVGSQTPGTYGLSDYSYGSDIARALTALADKRLSDNAAARGMVHVLGDDTGAMLVDPSDTKLIRNFYNPPMNYY